MIAAGAVRTTAGALGNSPDTISRWAARLRGETRLPAWNYVFAEIRPHDALGYLTPNAFYALLAQQAEAGRLFEPL